ncbi:hypothetical protein MMC25_001852 [Agyrium rufum]|nr:hypothetical protein [Agyrium rufum]
MSQALLNSSQKRKVSKASHDAILEHYHSDENAPTWDQIGEDIVVKLRQRTIERLRETESTIIADLLERDPAYTDVRIRQMAKSARDDARKVGTPGKGNELLECVPKLHYFELKSRGRGQVIRLLFEDADVAYIDIRYPFQEWPQLKQGSVAEMNPVKTLPILELNGQSITQSYPMLRYLAHKLDAYDGQDDYEKYFVDAMCDICIDWRVHYGAARFGGVPKMMDDHKELVQKKFLPALEIHLSTNELSKKGPFILSDRMTYADLVLFINLHDEELIKDRLADFPRVKQLTEGIQTRSKLEAYFKSDRYLG